MSRGHCGIGLYRPKTREGLGLLMRSAHSLGADWIFVIAPRFTVTDRDTRDTRMSATDTTRAARYLPLWVFDDVAHFHRGRPIGATVVGIECPGDDHLDGFAHPEQAVYLLGAEDCGLTDEALDVVDHVVTVPHGRCCLDVATAGAIVLYDRAAKAAAAA